MSILNLRLQHFRSYSDATFRLSPGVTIVVGPNASGKTNLLESILVMARGGSYRAKDADLIAFDQTWSRIDAETDDHTRTVKLEPTKSFIIGNQSMTRLSMQRSLPVVLFEPNHLLLLHGSPSLRRDFMDELIEQTQERYAATRRHYKRVLAQRGTLLKKNPKGLSEQLFVWNVRLSELGGQIARQRLELIRQLEPRVQSLYASLAGRGNVALRYLSPLPLDSYETALLQKLESNIQLDVLRGFTPYGPHRDDLQVLLDGRPTTEVASRGEMRTLVLALKIIELELLESARGQKPLLLLDDVFSELDSKRRQSLVSFVTRYQTLITTTDADASRYFTDSTIISTKI